MSARRTIAMLLLPAALAMAGCQQMPLSREAMQLKTAAERNDKAFDEAMGLAMQLKYQQACDRFEAVFPHFHAAGDTAGAAEAMFWVGYCYEKQGRTEQASAWYKRVVHAYLWEPAAGEALKRLNRLSSAPANAAP